MLILKCTNFADIRIGHKMYKGTSEIVLDIISTPMQWCWAEGMTM